MSLYQDYLDKQKNSTASSGGGLYDKYLASKNPSSNYFGKAVSAVTNYANESANTVGNVANAIAHPIKTFQKLPSFFTEPARQGIEKAGESLYGLATNNDTSKFSPSKVAQLSGIISGIAQTAFSPITGLFSLAEKTPGLKQVADTINLPFTGAGFVGSFGTGKIIDWIPESVLPKESKDIIRVPLQELGSLASQVLLGGKIMEKVGVYSDLSSAKPKVNSALDVNDFKSSLNKTQTQAIITKYGEFSKDQSGKQVLTNDPFQVFFDKHKVYDSSVDSVGNTVEKNQLGEVIKVTDNNGQVTYDNTKITPEEATKIVEEAKAETAAHPSMKPAASLYDQYQAEGSSVGVPSKSTLANDVPGAETQLPSFQTSKVKGEVPVSNRYTSPSHLTNLDELPIQDKVSTIRQISQDNLKPFVSDIEQATGLTLKPEDVRIKSEKSLTTKINEYVSGGRSVSEINDALGAAIKVSPKEISHQFENISKKFNIIETRNYFDQPNDWGYQGINIKVKLPNGVLAEIQIHTPESWKATQAIHKIYDTWKGKDTGKFTPAQEAAYRADKVLSNQIAEKINKGQKVSGVAASIESKAIEKGLTEGLNGLAGYDPVTIKEQARLASDLISSDLEKAKRMVRGEEPLPDNLRGAALIKGLEDYATNKGDVSLLQDLANSPLVAETSRHAQELRLLAERNPESPVKIMQDVKKAKETAFEKKTGKKVEIEKKTIVDEIKNEMKKSASKRPSWEEFIQTIQCGY